MQQMIDAFRDQMMLLVLIALGSMAVAWAVRGQRHWPFGIAPAPFCLACGSALAIAATTLTRQTGWPVPGQVRLQPFHTIRSYFGDPSDLVFYLGGNIALFAPLGFFLYLAIRRGLLLPIFVTALASVTVEICQLPIWSRSTDVDDVMLNSLGGLIGVLAAAAFARMVAIPGLTHQPAGRRRAADADAEPEQAFAALLPPR